MKKSKSIILLIVWFIWAAGKDLDAIVRFGLSTDFYVFSLNNLTPLFFVFAFTVFVLNTATVYCLFKPNPKGLYIAMNALVIAATQNIFTFCLALRDLDAVRSVYAASREARGLSVREEALNMIFSQQGMYTSLLIMCVLYLVIGFLVFKKRTYFERTLVTSS